MYGYVQYSSMGITGQGVWRFISSGTRISSLVAVAQVKAAIVEQRLVAPSHVAHMTHAPAQVTTVLDSSTIEEVQWESIRIRRVPRTHLFGITTEIDDSGFIGGPGGTSFESLIPWKEVQERMVEWTVNISTFSCSTFEDKSGTYQKLIENGRTLHFRCTVESEQLWIKSIENLDQLEDIGSKPLIKDVFTLDWDTKSLDGECLNALEMRKCWFLANLRSVVL